MVYAAVFWLL